MSLNVVAHPQVMNVVRDYSRIDLQNLRYCVRWHFVNLLRPQAFPLHHWFQLGVKYYTSKISTRWVPHLFSVENKLNRVVELVAYLSIFICNPEVYMCWYITVDKTLTYNYIYKTIVETVVKSKILNYFRKIMSKFFGMHAELSTLNN